MEFLDAEGNFTDEFRSDLPNHLGEEHAGTKLFDDIKTPSQLAKRFADTKKAFDTKMEGVIRKPGENATDEEIAEYKKTIATESGVPADKDGYEFVRPDAETLAKAGIAYDEELENWFRETAFAQGTPKHVAEGFLQAYNEREVGRLIDDKIAKDAAAELAIKNLETDWPGEVMNVNLRQIFNLVKQVGDADLVKQMNEAKLYENPKQLDKWVALLGNMESVRVWHKLAEMTKGSKMLPGGGGGGELTQRQKDMAEFPNSPGMWAPE